MRRILLLLILCFIGGVIYGGNTKKEIAIYTAGNIEKPVKDLIAAQFVSVLSSKQQYVVVERTGQFLSKLSKEQTYQLSGSVDDSKIRRLGIQAGASFVCIIAINYVLDTYTIESRVLNLESAVVEATASGYRYFTSMEDVILLSKAVAKQLCINMDK